MPDTDLGYVIMKNLTNVICILFGCMLVLSCGNKLSEQELRNLEIRAEKGDTEAALQLVDYYGHLELCNRETKEKAAQGDKDAQELVKKSNEIEEAYVKWLYKAAENGDAESAYEVAMDRHMEFTSNIMVKKNKREYRKFMEMAITGGYQPSAGGFMDEYKKYYQNQSEEWWDSDSIKTKEQLSEVTYSISE